MSAPYSGSIVGSWLFTRAEQATFVPRIIYHFTAAGECYWEQDHLGQRFLLPVKYRFGGNTLTLVYSSTSERNFELIAEEDGSVRLPAHKDATWWMVRLTTPEPYSKAFVDEHGQLQKFSPT